LKVLLNLCAFQKGYKELFSVQVKVRLAPNRAAVDDVVSRPIIMPMMSSSRFSTGGTQKIINNVFINICSIFVLI